MNYYRPEFIESDRQWLKFCPEGHQPCIKPYCPEGVQPCVDNGWASRKADYKKLVIADSTKNWFFTKKNNEEEQSSLMIVRKKKIEGGEVAESIEESDNKMIRIHYCTYKRNASEALRCLHHLKVEKILLPPEHKYLSKKFYNYYVGKGLQLCLQGVEFDDDVFFSIDGDDLDSNHPCRNLNNYDESIKEKLTSICKKSIPKCFLQCFEQLMHDIHAFDKKFKKTEIKAEIKQKKKTAGLLLFLDAPRQNVTERTKSKEYWESLSVLSVGMRVLYKIRPSKKWLEIDKYGRCMIGATDGRIEKINADGTYNIKPLDDFGNVNEFKKSIKKPSHEIKPNDYNLRILRSRWMSVTNLLRINKSIDQYEKENRWFKQTQMKETTNWEDWTKLEMCSAQQEKEYKESDATAITCVPSNNYIRYFPKDGLLQEIG